MIRKISILTMCAVIALLLGVHPFAVYLLAALVVVVVLMEDEKEVNTCETCKLPVYDWGQEASPQGGSCRDCSAGICARPDCAAEPVEVCCEECACEGLCWACASLRWCPEFPAAIIAANRLEAA